MGLMKRKEAQSFDPIKKGVYYAVVEKIQEKTNAKHPEWTPQIQFTFRLLQKPYKNRKAWGYAPSVLSEGQKLDKWITELLGHPIKEGVEFDILSLVGTTTKILVSTPDNSTYPRVHEILPLTEEDAGIVETLKAKSPVKGQNDSAVNTDPAPSAEKSVSSPSEEKSASPQPAPAPRRPRTVPF